MTPFADPLGPQRRPMDPLTPKSHGEEVAVFRHGLIGAIALRSLTHGERIALLRSVSEQRVRPPDSDTTRCYSVPTLERWLYAFKRGGLEALVPQARTDKGRGRDLPPELRELLCDIRREHPEVSVTLIVRTLRADGRIGTRGDGVHRAADVLREGPRPLRGRRWQRRPGWQDAAQVAGREAGRALARRRLPRPDAHARGAARARARARHARRCLALRRRPARRRATSARRRCSRSSRRP